MAHSRQQWLQAFTGGFLATLIFHQGVLALFWLGGMIPAFPWNMNPVPPLGVPQVISLAFWGGVWGGCGRGCGHGCGHGGIKS